MFTQHTQEPTLDRLCDRTIERALLSLILVEREIPQALRFLEPADLHISLHKSIYAAMRALQAQGQPIDLALLAGQMRQDKTLDELERAGGLPALGEWMDLQPTLRSAKGYARQVADLSGKRKLWIETARFLVELANGRLDDLTASDMRAQHIAQLEQLRVAPPAPRCATWADLEAQIGPIAWDWPGWLPRGFLVLLAGEAGLGKSLLALRLCACYLQNDPWPDGTPFYRPPASVVWCETEAAQVLNWERAASWGLPLERILAPLGALQDVSLDSHTHRQAIAARAQRPDVRLVVVDSFSGASRRDENSGKSLDAVRWLAALARDTGKPILLLHHLRKRGLLDGAGAVRLERLRGHSSIVQPARMVLALDAPDPNRPAYKRLSVIKSNLAPFPEPLGFWVTERGDIRFGEPPQALRSPSALDRATEAIGHLLQGGPVPAGEALAYLKKERISKRTAERAKAQMGVLSRSQGDHWLWELASSGSVAAGKDN